MFKDYVEAGLNFAVAQAQLEKARWELAHTGARFMEQNAFHPDLEWSPDNSVVVTSSPDNKVPSYRLLRNDEAVAQN